MVYLSAMNETRPLIGIGVVIQKDDKVLIGKRLKGHGAGTYQIPGGHFEFGETFEECAAREVLEETGLTISHDMKLISVSNDIAYEKHYVSLGMHVLWEAGEPSAMEDAASEWNWTDPRALPEPMFPHSRQVIENWLANNIYNP
jgi:8-oxo-dGTP diphosphatase